ncbi:uncharacterized protein HKW66_Vig0155810 [Vigna angularis]|uniref:Uncharacterized protein n=1 Tax=Phaseolus angularis TaxID=3914 RepID=A0A8T0JNR7_PHAAN|nr:uncharacterized protein HKW66_Vig0155810 [Vigna angularis]
MAVPFRMNHNKHGMLVRLKIFVNSQNFHSHAPKPAKQPKQDSQSPKEELDYSICGDRIGISEWSTLDAEKLGVTSSMISHSSMFVLKLLRRKGENILIPDEILRLLCATAICNLYKRIEPNPIYAKVKNHFRRSVHAQIVGRRFPICLVHIKGAVVEVTSFETVARTSNAKEQFLYSQLPKCSNKKDLFRCKNSLRRDFTINSLFYDPFANKIYDYTNGMADLRTLKNKIMIELNYMISYGAAEPSLRLLWKFKLLKFLLPLHAAYLDEQAIEEDDRASNLLLKLFFHLDKLLACDRPCDCTLWIGLLAFHLALVNDPQDAVVVWTFASVLHHGEWKEGVKFAKEQARMSVNFVPEIRKSNIYKSDDEIAIAVTKLASLVMHSIHALVDKSSLRHFMCKPRYPSSPQSDMVFVSGKAGKRAHTIFQMLANDGIFYKSGRKKNLKINYDMLGKGELSETGFVLGKIVLETMSSGIIGDGEDSEAGQCHLKTKGTEEIDPSPHPDLVNHQVASMDGEGQLLSIPNSECGKGENKKRKLVEDSCIARKKMGSGNHELSEEFERKENKKEQQKLVKLSQKVDPSMAKYSAEKNIYHRKQLINNRKKITSANKCLDQAMQMKTDEHSTCTASQSAESDNHQVIAHNLDMDAKTTDNNNLDVDAKTPNESDFKKKKNMRLSMIKLFQVK